MSTKKKTATNRTLVWILLGAIVCILFIVMYSYRAQYADSTPSQQVATSKTVDKDCNEFHLTTEKPMTVVCPITRGTYRLTPSQPIDIGFMISKPKGNGVLDYAISPSTITYNLSIEDDMYVFEFTLSRPVDLTFNVDYTGIILYSSNPPTGGSVVNMVKVK